MHANLRDTHHVSEAHARGASNVWINVSIHICTLMRMVLHVDVSVHVCMCGQIL
jgi:hypothetical protein